jgi:predicted ATPase/DNA-binding winged helix-turn-helix (wHTH) protein
VTEFRLLGPVQAVADGAVVPLGGPKQRAVLTELLLHGGGVVPRERLVDAVWGEEPPESAKTSLQVYVHGLRRAIGVDRIETHGDGYRLRLEPEELDLARFERLVAAGEQALGRDRPAEAAEDLEAAVRLWQGPPLADLADQPVARAAVPRLEELRLRAVELLIDARLALGEHEALLPELESLVAQHQFHERLREQHILALYRAGRQKAALDAYRAARRVLVDELGVEPGPALQELERAILRQDEDLLAPPAERARQLRLPRAATSLVGRRLEVVAVAALLRRDDVRLLTLTGVGGTGKTRLALAVAEELGSELRDGAAFVDLSTIRAGDAMLPAIAHALETGEAAEPLSVLRDRSLLLVLDNLEQIDDATGAILSLLDAAPRVRILATSRMPLRLSAEREYHVPPLPVPGNAASFEELVANDAVRLFASRAQAVDPEFALTDANVGHVASVCRRLDGLPLAIELAAARTRVLPPAAIESRLARALELLVAGARDRPARQQTLRATLDWSYDLLTLGERQLLADVSVFAGGWTLADADAVIGRDTSLDLEGLIESGLVRRRGTPDEPRFVLLETIREYAAEKLGEAPELHRAHALHVTEFAERAWADIRAGGEAEAAGHETLGREHDNVLAAVDWADATGDFELELRIAAAARWYWLVRGHLHEGRRVFERLLTRTEGSLALHAQSLVLGATFPWRLGEVAEAKHQWEKALTLFRELGDDENVARSIAELGAVAVSEDDLDRAVALYEEAAALFEVLGQTVRLAIALANLAAIAAQRDDPVSALAYGERAIALQRELGDQDGISVSLANIARVRLAVGDETGAGRDLHEALSIGKQLKYRMVLAHALGAAGEIAVRAGDAARATRLVGAAQQAFAELGVPVPLEEAEDHARTLARVAVTTEPDHVDALLREGAAISFDDAVDDALAVTA